MGRLSEALDSDAKHYSEWLRLSCLAAGAEREVLYQLVPVVCKIQFLVSLRLSVCIVSFFTAASPAHSDKLLCSDSPAVAAICLGASGVSVFRLLITDTHRTFRQP